VPLCPATHRVPAPRPGLPPDASRVRFLGVAHSPAAAGGRRAGSIGGSSSLPQQPRGCEGMEGLEGLCVTGEPPSSLSTTAAVTCPDECFSQDLSVCVTGVPHVQSPVRAQSNTPVAHINAIQSKDEPLGVWCALSICMTPLVHLPDTTQAPAVQQRYCSALASVCLLGWHQHALQQRQDPHSRSQQRLRLRTVTSGLCGSEQQWRRLAVLVRVLRAWRGVVWRGEGHYR
jgi:hypothetical protein